MKQEIIKFRCPYCGRVLTKGVRHRGLEYVFNDKDYYCKNCGYEYEIHETPRGIKLERRP